jgi:HSP20 family protein
MRGVDPREGGKIVMKDTSEIQKKEGQSTELQSSRKVQPMTASPFGFVRRFAENMERMFEDFDTFRFPNFFKSEFDQVGWMPEVEVLQRNGELIVRADLPGLNKDDVKVDLTDEMLAISGERKEEKEEKREGYYHSERSYGTFYRQIPLPEGAKTETATAKFTDGVLEITMQAPKREPHTRRLEIKAAEETAKAKAAA